VTKGKSKNTFFPFGLIFEKKAIEPRLWGHTQSSAHPVLFGKHRHIAVFLPLGMREFSSTFLVVLIWILLVASL